VDVDLDKELPLLPHERTRREKVVVFVVSVIEAMGMRGLLARLKQDHRRKMGVVLAPEG
jgi:hypothetical protein